jgi:hypothetical protein
MIATILVIAFAFAIVAEKIGQHGVPVGEAIEKVLDVAAARSVTLLIVAGIVDGVVPHRLSEGRLVGLLP